MWKQSCFLKCSQHYFTHRFALSRSFYFMSLFPFHVKLVHLKLNISEICKILHFTKYTHKTSYWSRTLTLLPMNTHTNMRVYFLVNFFSVNFITSHDRLYKNRNKKFEVIIILTRLIIMYRNKNVINYWLTAQRIVLFTH